MRISTMIAASVLSLAIAAPAVAQDAMMKSGGMMKMSAGDTKRMKACNAMSHTRMMKNARCAAMMKAHPGMMKHGSMMKHDDEAMMKHGAMMKKGG